MKIVKEANAGGGCEVREEDLLLINKLAPKELMAEEVYTFSVRLCDNEIDREWERFPKETLEALAPMFVGKSGLFDHNWSAAGQSARLYKTEVVTEEGQVTRAGDESCYLKGWAYMLRTEGNRDLIAEIEGGIKKEVSVGCSVGREVCSVCGEEMGRCRHVKGRTYNGKLCWGELMEAGDAYEWSFVAVPAQARAGVIKGMSPALKELARQEPEARAYLEGLEKAAEVGRRYLTQLRQDTVRLMTMGADGVEAEAARTITRKLDEEELNALRAAFAGKEKGHNGVQLSYGRRGNSSDGNDGAFLI